MIPVPSEELQEAFEELCDLDPGQRGPIPDEPPGRRAALEALLAAHDKNQGRCGLGVPPRPGVDGDDAEPTWNPGHQPVPGYTVQGYIGGGGAGQVYRATAPGGLPVALK